MILSVKKKTICIVVCVVTWSLSFPIFRLVSKPDIGRCRRNGLQKIIKDLAHTRLATAYLQVCVCAWTWMYDGPSVKERINLNLFSLPFIGEWTYIWIYFHSRLLGGENIFEFIFTPVYCGEKTYLNLFSLPFVGERKYIWIYFHSRLLGRKKNI